MMDLLTSMWPQASSLSSPDEWTGCILTFLWGQFFLFPSFDCHIAGLLCNPPWMPLSPCRHQFTSGNRLSGESGCQPRWDRPHEHRWTAACVGVPPTGPGHHTGKSAGFKVSQFLCYLQLMMEDTESYGAYCCCRTNSHHQSFTRLLSLCGLRSWHHLV